MALVYVAGISGQAATTSVNPLNAFISGAASAVGALSTAVAQESTSATSSPQSTTASSTPSSTASSIAAAAAGGLSSKDILIIVIVSIVVGFLLLALLGGLIYCCVSRRRRRRRADTTNLPEDEIAGWRKPTNPGRAYTPVDGSGRTPDMAQQPTIPLMTPANIGPTAYDHPTYRHENPFVPVPPPHRKVAPNSHTGLTGAAIPGTDPYVGAHRQSGHRLRKSQSQSRSNSSSALSDSFARVDNGRTPLPVHHNGVSNGVRNAADRPSTPFGLAAMTGAGVATAGMAGANNGHDHRTHRPGSPYNLIGQPYEDTHVHRLVTDVPSNDLQEVPLITPDGISPRFSTPPNAPGRSPHRHSPGPFRDSTYNSSPYGSYSDTPSGNGSGTDESWRTTQMGITPEPPTAPWDDRQRRWSSEGRQRSYSGSPRQSTSIPRAAPGGTPRRLRFSDFEHDDLGREHNQGIGEAL
ncbi:MAG: hypothetical protein MMC33_002141 [Icmadophila ericetorum]|nr:hypothetical protein [Icmadophila ericetorum]